MERILEFLQIVYARIPKSEAAKYIPKYENMATQQEDGYYPRVNSSMLQNYDGKIISVIGSFVSFDGSNMTLKSADGGDIRVLVNDPNFEHQQVWISLR